MTTELPPLPALRSLGELADLRPTVVIDTREQTPLEFTRLSSVTATLTTGDYSVMGLERDFAVERKSVADLVGSLTTGRERFQREVDRLRAYPFARLLVIGREEDLWKGGTRFASMAPRALLHSIYSIEARGLPVVFSDTPEQAARLVERWAWWRARTIVEATNAILRSSGSI